MPQKTMEISVRMNAKIFRSFSIFDTFFRQKRWTRLAIFAGILTISALICLTKPEGLLLFGVLMAVGWGVPAVYVGTYLHSVNEQAKKFCLKDARPVYTLTLTDAPDGLAVQSSSTARRHYNWADCFGVWRRTDCTYLYITPTRAFLLPDDQFRTGNAEALWALLGRVLPAEKLHRK